MPGRPVKRAGRGHLGVWDPTGGEARRGSGLPVEAGEEEISILARAGGRVWEVEAEGLAGTLREAEMVWIDLLRPHDRSRAILEEVLELAPLTVEDCLSPLRMPKVDFFGGGAFVAGFAARLEGDGPVRLSAVEVDLVFGESWLVTVRDGPLEEVRARIGQRLASPAGTGTPGAELAYRALDALVDGHLPALVRVAAAAEELESSLDPTRERASLGALEALISMKRDLQAFRRLAVAQQEVIRRLGRSFREQREYLSDVSDNQREAVDMADATRDYVDGAIEAYRMRRDERSELGIRRLTVLAALLGPLSVLAGWYGVNFKHLPGQDNPAGFWVFIAVQLVFVLVSALYLRRRGLL
ncbi:magnesium transporter CorA family protein [Rubrobacter calidifluminis]|uniref:magnesium transporter CorA family protein n=1 Tax=Rubrobacter calidifluminis TaxID=1392640 RepID=UPI002361C96F|nr:magnesium transporter CorA family protein [Rubrobacter calidifluminis]